MNRPHIKVDLMLIDEVLIDEICQKEFKMGPQTFKYLVNMIRLGIENMEFFNWDSLSY